MSVLNIDNESRRFSFEVLPPLKGTGTEKLFADIDKLREFDPAYINITTHHSEFVYRELENGQFDFLICSFSVSATCYCYVVIRQRRIAGLCQLQEVMHIPRI